MTPVTRKYVISKSATFNQKLDVKKYYFDVQDITINYTTATANVTISVPYFLGSPNTFSCNTSVASNGVLSFSLTSSDTATIPNTYSGFLWCNGYITDSNTYHVFTALLKVF